MKKRGKKKAAKKEERKIKLQAKAIWLVILAAAVTYIAYYLKFPNSWSIFVGIVFLALLIKNWSTKKGIEIFIYLLILNALVLPLIIFSLAISLIYQIILLIVLIVIINLIVNGLLQARKWALWLTIIVLIVSIVNLLLVLANLIAAFIQIPPVSALAILSRALFISANSISLLLGALFLAYFIKIRKIFKKN